MKPFYKCSNKCYYRFHLKMESNEKTAAAIVALLLVKKNKKKRKRSVWVKQFMYSKCHFVFLINWNTKLEIKFWFSFLYWNWDIKHKTNWFFVFQNTRTLKFKLEVRFSFFILIWKTESQIYLNKYLIKLVTRSHYAITINK